MTIETDANDVAIMFIDHALDNEWEVADECEAGSLKAVFYISRDGIAFTVTVEKGSHV